MKIGIVTPWFGEKVAGGAERYAGGLARAFSNLNLQVEVITTCGEDSFSGWDHNYYKEGVCEESGIIVRRFGLRKRNRAVYDKCFGSLIQHKNISYVEELQLQHETINSDSMYKFIQENCSDYVFLFIPYYYGTFVWGAQIVPKRSFLIPCLHDEEIAYFKLMRDVFTQSCGCIFNTEEERELAKKIYDLDEEFGVVTGVGVELDYVGEAEAFRRKYGIKDTYILYVGRKVDGKNVPMLISLFKTLKHNDPDNSIKLVLIGKGEISDNLKHPDVIDLGELDEKEKLDGIAGALVLCQPSVMESFSLVIMEAWLSGVPVLVNSESNITVSHVKKSQGGLTFNCYQTFVDAITQFINSPESRTKMAEKGHQYVTQNYNWQTVTSKILKLIRSRGFNI
ncbi:MAG: glycosyltransferase family 4 protein [Clostridia bacterium]|nr:glycosyltransferase family 4 protein [Clostridia bacterium]